MERLLLLVAAILMLLLIMFAVSTPSSNPETMGEIELAPPNDEWFQEHVVARPVPVLVDFNAQWCGPCKMMEPFLERLKHDYEGRLEIVGVDIDAHPGIASHYQATAIPLLLLMDKGKVLDGIAGVVPYTFLQKFVDPHVAEKSEVPQDETEPAAVSG